MMSTKKLCVVIPMKDPTQSKQRLHNILKRDERKSLALGLFEHTLSFLHDHFPSITVLVVTPSKDIAKLSYRYNAKSLIEKNKEGLNHALTDAAQWCIDHHFSSQLTLPADIVNLDPLELKLLIKAFQQQPSVTICPAHDGGTNALLTTPPNVIPFCYGQNSSQQHSQQANARGITPKIILLDQLAFDLDTPTDYQMACKDNGFQNVIRQHMLFGQASHYSFNHQEENCNSLESNVKNLQRALS